MKNPLYRTTTGVMQKMTIALQEKYKQAVKISVDVWSFSSDNHEIQFNLYMDSFPHDTTFDSLDDLLEEGRRLLNDDTSND